MNMLIPNNTDVILIIFFHSSSDSDCFKFSALADGLKESEQSNDQFIRQKMPGELFDMNKQCNTFGCWDN